ncbi:MAG: YARHG domain-containing protein [Candidatus Eisenbacteria bacterium]|nr:YARHG domain-containing protein [Candidatus Eisenbacteria bacterium]
MTGGVGHPGRNWLVVALLVLVAPDAPFAAPTSQPSTAGDLKPRSRPLYADRDIVLSDLEGRTLRELSLMRNWIYARAGNPFRRAWLRDFFGRQSWYRPLAQFDPDRLSDVDRRNATTIARFDLSLTHDVLSARRERLLVRGDSMAARGDSLSRDEQIERMLLGERLGLVDSTQAGEPGATDGVLHTSPLADLSRLDRQITIPDLYDLSRRDLYLLRNTIYARRGRPFQKEFLVMHFHGFIWYAPDSTYADSRLSTIDRRNVLLIRSLEDELGGPISDDEAADTIGFA